MLVSVIIPAYNAEKFIRAAIDSVLAQTIKDLEIIVVDDCSQDTTRSIVQEILAKDHRVRLICLPSNSGSPAKPRNVGIKESSGRYLAFLDADDIWHCLKLEFQLKVMIGSGNWMCSTEMTDGDERKMCKMLQHTSKMSKEVITFRKQLWKYRTPTSSIIMERYAAKCLRFPEDIRYRGREDLAYFLKAHEIFGDSVKICLPLTIYRKHAEQISSNKIYMYIKIQMVLNEYRFEDGTKIGLKRYFYLFVYGLYAVYYRIIVRKL